MIWGDVERLGAIIEAVGSDPAIDQLLVLYDHPEGLSAEADRTWGAVREGILSGAARTDAAVIVCSTLPDLIDDAATAELGAHGVVGLAGLGTGLVCALALRGAPADPSRLRAIAAAARAAGQGSGPDGHLDEHEAKLLLAEAGVAVPRGRVADDAGDAVAAWRELGAEVALKAVRPGLLHKSDAGGLALGLGDEVEIEAAFGRLLSSESGARVLVEEMVSGEVELLAGFRDDGVVPALAIGIGGIWAEAIDDVAIVPMPADADRVERAIRSLRAAPLLTGGRGRSPLAVRATAELVARACGLAVERGLSLLELNPVIIGREGAVAVDAVARFGPE